MPLCYLEKGDRLPLTPGGAVMSTESHVEAQSMSLDSAEEGILPLTHLNSVDHMVTKSRAREPTTCFQPSAAGQMREDVRGSQPGKHTLLSVWTLMPTDLLRRPRPFKKAYQGAGRYPQGSWRGAERERWDGHEHEPCFRDSDSEGEEGRSRLVSHGCVPGEGPAGPLAKGFLMVTCPRMHFLVRVGWLLMDHPMEDQESSEPRLPVCVKPQICTNSISWSTLPPLWGSGEEALTVCLTFSPPLDLLSTEPRQLVGQL